MYLFCQRTFLVHQNVTKLSICNWNCRPAWAVGQLQVRRWRNTRSKPNTHVRQTCIALWSHDFISPVSDWLFTQRGRTVGCQQRSAAFLAEQLFRLRSWDINGKCPGCQLFSIPLYTVVACFIKAAINQLCPNFTFILF